MYEWDDRKRQANIEKHGIDFIDVLPLFNDPAARVLTDRRGEHGEERFILLGLLQERLYQVAFTRRGPRIRIISARRGNQRERKHYDKLHRN